MAELAEFLLVLVVGIPTIVIAVTSIIVLYFRYSKRKLKPLDPTRYPQKIKAAEVYSEWALQNGFEWIGAYRSLIGTYVVVWSKRDEPTYFCVYILAGGKLARELGTILNGDKELTTGDLKDANPFPTAPGFYVQTFPGCSIQEQWDRHQRSLEYPAKTYLATVKSSYISFEEVYCASLTKQMKYVMSLPLWPLRLPYWIFVRSRKTRGLSVEQLIEMGLARPE